MSGGTPGRRTLTSSVRRKASGRREVGALDAIATAAVDNKGAGAPLESGFKSGVETQHGADLSHVRVHSDALANEAAEGLGARAFTHGSDVFLGAGESATDPRLMGHELAHVVQQDAVGRLATMRQVSVGASDHPAEAAADRAAERVAAPAEAGGVLIVADDATRQAGQLGRAEFLAVLRAAMVTTVSAAVGPEWSEEACPYIVRWFTTHANDDPASLDRMARRFSGVARPASAQAMIEPICERARAGIVRYRAGEDVSGDLAAAGFQDAGSDAAATSDATRTTSELGAGTPLDGSVAARMSDAMGTDLSGVRIHTDERAARVADREDARAVTVGQHVAFGAGEYNPGTMEGDALIAHELAHTQQQASAPASGGVARRSESEAHEHDADHAATGILGRLWSGSKSTISAALGRTMPALRSGLEVQRCSRGRSPAPVPRPDPKPLYRTAFNSRWAAHTERETFDPTMSSGGPRSPRARAIFREVMAAEATLRAAYDANEQGMRDYVDIYEYPDPPPPPPPAPPPPPVVTPSPPASTPGGGTRDGGTRDGGTRDGGTRDGGTSPPARPNAGFLSQITFAGNPGTVSLSTDNRLEWTMRSGTTNPGPEVARRVQITTNQPMVDPAREVWSEEPWAVGQQAGPPHVAHVQPTGAPPTRFTAVLSIPSEPTFTAQSASIDVTDTRRTWFTTNISNTVAYTEQQAYNLFTPGSTTPIHYYAGSCMISAYTKLSANNPGLNVFVSATVTRNGTAAATFPSSGRTPFPLRGDALGVGSIALTEPTPPPATPDRVEVVTHYWDAQTGGTEIHHLTETVLIAAAVPTSAAAINTALSHDNDHIRDDVLPHMERPASIQLWRDMARLIRSGRIHAQGLIMRPDSTAEVARRGGSPATQAAWYAGDTTRTLLLGHSAKGTNPHEYPDYVFVVRTLNTNTGTARSLDEMATDIAHEGVHAADSHVNPGSPWDMYQREFRAYWIEGHVGHGLPTGPMEPPPAIGPNSARANAIFRHLYGNSSYSYVQPAYDADTDGFRQKANAMLHPDGVNLTLSGTLFDLQREVESYNGTSYAAKRTAIQGKYTACTADDKNEIHRNNQWRRLVEVKFNGTQRTEIMGDLQIP